MPATNHRSLKSNLPAVILMVTTGCAIALGQSAVPAGATRPGNATDDTTVTLSPFIISTDKDTGYIAADTVSAGRLSTNLLMTPGDIDVMTRDLLNDLGMFNIDEASGWLTNSRPLELGAIEGNSINPSGLGTDDSATNVSLRGLGGQPSTRNYFASGSTPKEYNVERVESARGPNAILYGEGGAGGQVNYNTKQAQNRNFGSLRLRADSLRSRGVALDLNRKLSNQLALRYNFNWLDQRYHIERTRFENNGNALSLVYRPFQGTTVSVEADFTRTSRPGLIMSYSDQYMKWNRTPLGLTKLSSAAATAAGLANRPTASTHIWVNGLGMLNLAGWAQTTGFAIPLPTEYEYPDIFPGAVRPPARSFNANPKQADVLDHTADVQFAVDHSFRNKLSVQFAGQYGKYTAEGGNAQFVSIFLDPLPYLPNATNTALDPTKPNPNYLKQFTYTSVGRQIDASRQSRSLRVAATYPVRLLGTTTNLSVLGQRQELDTRTAYYDPHIVDPASTAAITDASSLINVIRYLDDLPPSLPDFRSMYSMRDVPTADSRSKRTNDSFMSAASGRYLHDTLSVIVGFRRDKSDVTTTNGDVASRDRVTGEFTTFVVDPRLAYNNSATFGLVYFPVRFVGAYVNHAEGFQVQSVGVPKLDGTFTHANIVPATDNSYGLRFNLGNGRDVKVVGSVGYYKVEQRGSNLGISVGYINTLWRNHGMPDRYIETFYPDLFAVTNSNSVASSKSFVGWGWEGSLTANVGTAFRVTFNAALPKTKQSEVAADYVAYTSANMGLWQQWASDPNNPSRATDAAAVTSVQSALAGFQEGRAQNGTYKYRYNVFGVYTVPRTPLKGMRLGLGAQFYGPMIIGNEINRPYDYVYRDAYHMLTANVGYPFRIGKRKVDLQCNIDNLLNYDKPLINGLSIQTAPSGASVNVPYGFKYAWPRAARLTLSLPF